MPNPVGLNSNVNYIGNNIPNVGNVNNVGNVANVGINVAPELDAAGKANAIYKASVVATEIDVLITKAASSSVGSLDGEALEKAIAAAKLGKSTKKELQATIAGLVGNASSSMNALSIHSGDSIARAVRSAKDDANNAVSELEKKGEIAARACTSLGIDKLDDPPTKEQAEAVEAEKRRAFDESFQKSFRSSRTGKAIAAALQAQNELSDRLSDLINGHVSSQDNAFSNQVAQFREKLNKLSDKAAGDILAVLEEAKFQCDRRVCELETLELTLCDLVDATAEDAEIDESITERSATSLMADSASRMHGNATVLKSLDAKINSVAEKIRGLGGDTADVGQEQLGALADDVKSLQKELANAAATGYIEIDVVDEAASGPEQKKKAKLYVDRTFIDQASRQVDEAAGKLKDFTANMRREALTTILDKSFNLHQFRVFDEKYLPLLKSKAPNAYKLGRIITDFEKACRAFIAAPSAKTEEAMHTIACKVSRNWMDANIESAELELRSVFKALSKKGNSMTLIEKNLSADLLGQLSGLVTKDDDAPADDPAFEKFLYRHVASLDKAATLLATESKKFTEADKSRMLVSGAVRNVFEGKATLTTIINARINGLSDNDADASFDDRNVESQATLGAGAMNSVTLVNYNDGSERVFKSDAAGRIALTNSPLVGEMDINVSIAKLNLATMKTAKAFGLEDAVVKTTVGVHDGQSGIFMEKAPGTSGKSFSKSKDLSSANDDEHSLGDIRNMMNAPVDSEERTKGERITAELMRQTTRLEWLDILSGQGDRHRENFFVHVGKDGTVNVKGIDNDSCFSMHRTGLTTFVLKGADNYEKFMYNLQLKCDKVFGEGSVASSSAYERLMNSTGLKVTMKGGQEMQRNSDNLFDMDEADESNVESFSVDFSQISDPLLISALKDTLGVNALHVPTCIDEDTYNHLMAMDGDTEARRNYLNDIKASLGEGDAFNNAVSRLDDSIRYAKQLKAQGKVYGKDKWVDVVRGTSDADKQVRSELANMQQPVVNTGTATRFDNNAINSIQNTTKQLTSSFYARITA